MESGHREKHSLAAVNIGLAANALLAGLKTSIGIVGHSPALLADGVNSTSDVAYYVVVKVFMALAHKPADEEHPYGHRQMESISALVVGAFVITTGIAIFWDAANKAYDGFSGRGDPVAASLGALAVAGFTVAMKVGLTLFTQRIGRQTRNPAVLALAYDHRNDIFAASAAGVGILLGRMGITWGDPLAGAVVALVILRTGAEIVRESSSDLMDTVPSRMLREQAIRVVSAIPGVLEVEEVLAHRFGPYLVINITVALEGTSSVAEGDRVATDVEAELIRDIELVKRVHVHYHPKQNPPPSARA